ncbi:hypothetical protein [Rickettsiales endosymbiont of Stachyamoeba lipophora]|uniref:hypothetical protein n=1 Tax=Rickettsiales endosymbiont of Stachyamoeba lipophora TaxID=2486578 RepID=UPI000F6473E4|nr:hypothetical protein [Rickettsiales endosymbiont of Stachyamoeba lipophora]AZL15503.1 hypothetical protein EF513_02910 [Rickettsiales endosymbiont of Stachyamoeba lipophora]
MYASRTERIYSSQRKNDFASLAYNNNPFKAIDNNRGIHPDLVTAFTILHSNTVPTIEVPADRQPFDHTAGSTSNNPSSPLHENNTI